MQKLFTRYISIVIMISSVIISIIAWQSLESIEIVTAENTMKQRLTQLCEKFDSNKNELETLTNNLHKDYLTRAYAFAYIVQKNPEVINSLSELEKIKDLLQVDELHVIDKNGILIAGSIPKYIGMDFRSTKQTSEFLQILDHKTDELIQKIQPNGAEKKVFQYIGVRRQDEEGIIQIGISPTTLLEAQKRNEISYVLDNLQLGHDLNIVCVNKDNEKIAYTGMDEKDASTWKLTYDAHEQFNDGGTYTWNNEKHYVMSTTYDDMAIFAMMPQHEVFADRNSQMGIIVICMVVVSIITILVLNLLIKKNITNGIKELSSNLHRISNGELDTVVSVDTTPEFQQISSDINKMVQSILNTTVKVSKIIDIIDMPIGVFEMRKEGDIVLVNDRLKHIMLWSDEEAEAYFKDKALFLSKLKEITNHEQLDDAYRIHKSPELWVRLYFSSDDDSFYGIITDVTKEIKEKKNIEYQRDHDNLTGLNNMHHFKEMISRITYQKHHQQALIMLDLDHFKNINDTFGHDWGDIYLQKIAMALNALENDHCITARRSGDEFCIFFYHFENQAMIREIMHQFYHDLSMKLITFPDGTKKAISISAGLSWCNQNDTIDVWLKQADMALYDSKHRKRGALSEFKEDGLCK